MAKNGRLSPRQRRAIAAILTARNLGEAAKNAGVGERSLHRWLGDPAFQAELREAEQATLDLTARRLLDGQGLALDTLKDLMSRAESEHVRRSAAETWLAYTARYREMTDISRRLDELEAAIYDHKK